MPEDVISAQKRLCRDQGVGFFPAHPDLKAGVARNLRSGQKPLNGLRHPPTPSTTGWYIWAGGEPSVEDDFFLPLHVAHLLEWCPLALKYLGLPPGWRFLTDGIYEDIWFDPGLLD